jgi:hypothetical protein
MAVYELLAAKRDDVIQRWKAQVQGTLAPEAMPPLELINPKVSRFDPWSRTTNGSPWTPASSGPHSATSSVTP